MQEGRKEYRKEGRSAGRKDRRTRRRRRLVMGKSRLRNGPDGLQDKDGPDLSLQVRQMRTLIYKLMAGVCCVS